MIDLNKKACPSLGIYRCDNLSFITACIYNMIYWYVVKEWPLVAVVHCLVEEPLKYQMVYHCGPSFMNGRTDIGNLTFLRITFPRTGTSGPLPT